MEAARVLDEIAGRVAAVLGATGHGFDSALLQWSLYNNFGGARSSVVAFGFVADVEAPRLVVKLSRAATPIEREHRALARLSEVLPGRVPRPYMAGNLRGFAFLAMQPLAGRAMAASELERHFGAVLATLLELHAASRPGVMGPEDLDREVLDPLGAAERDEAGRAPEVVSMCAALRKQIDELARLDLPKVAQHGDFTLRNIVLGPRNEPAVIDWEEYGGVHVPGYDLVVLLATLVGRDPWGESGLRRMLGEGLRLYARRLGFDPGWLPALVPCHLLRFWLFCRAEGREQAADLVMARLQALARRLARGETLLP
jgi:aminoglycoside phosphotransferase (APT) family kinase protein